MIDFYTWSTPNGQKVSIMLEETGLPYKVIAVNLRDNQQLEPQFVAMNPNHRIPVIVDRDAPGAPLTVIESGAILIYLAEKTGKLLATDVAERSAALQWLMFQMAHVGPMFGQLNYFANTMSEKVPVAIQRFMDESLRIMRVLNTRLSERAYLAGAAYSIADIATYPWAAAGWNFLSGMLDDSDKQNLKRWLDAVAARPAVQRGMAVPKL